MKYFESKDRTYKNNTKRLYRLNEKFQLFELKPYKRLEKNGVSYGLSEYKGGLIGGESVPKIVDEGTLSKYYLELTRKEFIAKSIINIPVG